MVKFVIYTSNLPFMPKSMEDVINFAKENNKFRICSVELNPYLANVKAGDNIITKKGNSIYIIKAISESLDNLDDETKNYLDYLTREFGLKKVGITSVETINKFETWCKYAKPIINNSKTSNKMSNSNSNSIKGIKDRLTSMFMPTKAEDVRIATDGNICVATSNGYVAIDANNNLTSYPAELTLKLPVYIISKPKEQLMVGDVIALDRSYAKITKISGGKISAISYTGTGKVIHTIKDFLFNQTMVRVVCSLAGNLGGQINPMLMLALADNGDKDSLLPLLMMSQNGGALGINPMMLMMLSDKGEGTSMKDMLMVAAMSGNNMFGNMFAPVQQVPANAPTKPKKVKEPKAEEAETVEPDTED